MHLHLKQLDIKTVFLLDYLKYVREHNGDNVVRIALASDYDPDLI